jgi:calcium-dependent protein kinase
MISQAILLIKSRKKQKNLISSLLTRDPSKRISAEEALNHVWFKKLKTKEKLNELVKNNKFKFINNLKNYRTDKVLQSAALAYLVHNFNQMEDVREANKLFNSIDVNGDGKITKIELLTGLKKVLNISDDSLEEDVDKIFKNIDADNNGYIEFEEFVRGCIDKEKLLSEDVLKFAFRYFDKDGSGEITREEIKEIFFANAKKNDNVNLEQQLEYIISEVDINGDGKISIDEFTHMMKNIIN